MIVFRLSGVLLCGLVAIAASAQPVSADYVYGRRYVTGERYQYEMHMSNEGSPQQQTAVSDHAVLMRDGIPYERIEWVQLTDTEAGDLTPLARKAAPLELSMHPKGQFTLVKPVGNPQMMGPVTDLFTFLFAVSPQAGAARIRRPGEEHLAQELIRGDFSDGNEFLVGKSCTQLRVRLQNVYAKTASYESSFRPPAGGCDAMSREWMNSPVCGGQVNNFQMIRRQGEGYLAAWGCEQFTITSLVDKSTGRIESAEMDNQLRWNLKYCLDRELNKCTDLPQMTKRRHVRIALRR